MCALCLPAAATAQDEEAKQRFFRGQAAYERGDYETAISEWKAAYAIDARPLLQYNLSQAYERLGQLSEAAGALERYLADSPEDAPYRTRAQSRLEAIRGRLESTGLEIHNAPPGTTVLVDGEERGRTPLTAPISVEPGTHHVTLRHMGYREFRIGVSVPAGRVTQIEAQLVEQSAMPPAQYAMQPAASPSLWPYVLMGGGGALLLAGALVGLQAVSKADDAPTRNGNEADDARQLAAIADTTMGLGILTAGAGLVWFVLDQPNRTVENPPSGRTVRVSPAVSPQGGMATATVTF